MRNVQTVVGLVIAAMLIGGLLGEGALALGTPQNSIVELDSGTDATSLALDASGNPVIAYEALGELKIVHCGNANCTSGNTTASPDPAAYATSLSLRLDGSGFPVVSYQDISVDGGDLKVLHCGDTTCSSGNSVTTPDGGAGVVGEFSSLTLDGSGNPVISYFDETNLDLNLIHCDDVNCAGIESVRIPDSVGFVGAYTSIALDGVNPVVSYYDFTNDALKVLHCADPGCTAIKNITTPDADGGVYSSLALDSSANPVISYSTTSAGLRVMHCNDRHCAGNDESIAMLDPASFPEWTSLKLDAAGNPVVSYGDSGVGQSLVVLRCSDANCSGAYTVALPFIDRPGDGAPRGTSLALDAAGNPVVSFAAGPGELELLHCGNQSCILPEFTTPDLDAYGRTALALDSSGRPVIAYQSGGDLKVMRCGNADCTSGNSVASPDPGSVPFNSVSIALDGSGFPVVAYHGGGTGELSVLHCGNAICTAGNSVTSPDSSGTFGWEASLVLDAGGRPVISYQDTTNLDLKLLHCDDPNCAGSETVRTLDSAGSVGSGSSVRLDGVNPVVSYFDATNGDLKVLHCADPGCSAVKSITSPDTTGVVGGSTSLALDGAGNPVISYTDFDNSDLKVMHCDDRHCAPGGDSIATPDTVGDVGRNTSLALDAMGRPVVAYQDFTNHHLKVLRCGNPNCTFGNVITAPDTDGDVPESTSLKLDANGRPVIAYVEGARSDLRVLHCTNTVCSGDFDGDGCPDASEALTGAGTELLGGRRNPKNPHDYFNPDGNGQNRVDDILDVVNAYFMDDSDGNPGSPPYAPGYNPSTDRSNLTATPNAWNTGAPDGLQRVQDILHMVNQYFHDCA